MKISALCLGILLCMAACHPDNHPPLPNDTVQLNGQNWAFSSPFGLVRTPGLSAYHNIIVKFDGADGSFLYVLLAKESLANLPALPANLNGQVYYYQNSSINAPVLKGDAIIELLTLDVPNKEIKLKFDAVLNENTSDEMVVQSGDIGPFSCETIINGHQTMVTAVDQAQEEWHVSEMGAELVGGQLEWFMYNPLQVGTASIYINIPWHLPAGNHPMTQANPQILRYYQGAPYVEWVMESANIQVDSNQFEIPVQMGSFEAVFHHPEHPDEKVFLKNGRLEARFD